MNAVGIDISRGKSMVAVLRPFGEVVMLPFEVGHSNAELNALAEQLKSIEGETRVVMEHTGRYYEPVANALHNSGLFVSAVNPLLIKEYGGNSLRKVKTDKADAQKIARYTLDNWADLRDYTPMDTIRYDLKTLNRQFNLSSKQKTASANNLIALLEQTFPASVNALTVLCGMMVRKNGSTSSLPFGTLIVFESTAKTHLPSVIKSGAKNTDILFFLIPLTKCMPLPKTLSFWFQCPKQQKLLFKKLLSNLLLFPVR